MRLLIPKILHYCWFGGSPLPKEVKKNIENWKKKAPDFKIIQWNEKNYDIDNTCSFVKEAYEQKKWSFVSDYVRLEVIYKLGGVYLDTDVKLLSNLDDVILSHPNGYMGFEKKDEVNTGLGFSAPAKNIIVKEMIDYYQSLHFNMAKIDVLRCPYINTKILINHGLILNNTLQSINKIDILPIDYLSPNSLFLDKSNFTENTLSIHEYKASWMKKSTKFRIKTIVLTKKILPLFVINVIRDVMKGKN